MSDAQSQVRVRSILFNDLANIISVDQAIREEKVSVTYENFTTKDLLGLGSGEVDSKDRARLMSEIIGLLDLGFVAELEGQVCGFIIGRQSYLIEYGTERGEIAMIGIHPGYQHKGIGEQLINEFVEHLRRLGVQKISTLVDWNNTQLIQFFSANQFSPSKTINLERSL